jgi:hypothetical protein
MRIVAALVVAALFLVATAIPTKTVVSKSVASVVDSRLHTGLEDRLVRRGEGDISVHEKPKNHHRYGDDSGASDHEDSDDELRTCADMPMKDRWFCCVGLGFRKKCMRGRGY